MIADSIERLTANWWTFLVRGILALALAAVAFSSPGVMASALVYVVAAFFIVSGATALFAGFSFSGAGHWWTLILSGALQLGLGIYMLATPGVGPLALAYLFAIWMLSTGLLEITGAIALRSYIDSEFWWVLLGLITVAFGVYVVVNPGLGLYALVYTVGFYAILAGVTLIALSFRIKNAGPKLASELSPR